MMIPQSLTQMHWIVTGAVPHIVKKNIGLMEFGPSFVTSFIVKKNSGNSSDRTKVFYDNYVVYSLIPNSFGK